MLKMHVLNIAYTDSGGAGIASTFLNELLNTEKIESLLLVKKTIENKNNIIAINKVETKLVSKIRIKFLQYLSKIRKKDNKNRFVQKFSFLNISETEINLNATSILKKIPFKPDIIVLHWISNFVNAKTINDIYKETNAKIFWIMMDNAPITGGCHYTWNCKGFQENCDECPAILNEEKKSEANRNLQFKKQNLPEKIELIVGSEFDYQKAIKSSLFKNKKIHKILFPVNEEVFVAGINADAKKHFGINPQKKVIFYGSLSLNNQRKGSKYFLEGLKIFEEFIKKTGKDINNYQLLIAGKGCTKIFKNLKISCFFSGYLSEHNLVKAYQAADVFINTSIEDSGPLMINQSIMCGTPVVAFETGVALDIVITGVTGYRAQNFNSKDLANGIQYVLSLNEEESDKMKKKCRDLAIKTYGAKKQLSKYIKLFSES